MMQNVVKTTLVLVIAVIAILVVREGFRLSPTGAVVYSGEKAKVDFFVMSQCPYGAQVENAVYPLLKKFGSAVDFRINFIGEDNNGVFSSLHGDNEVKGDIAQLCAQKYNPDKFMDMVKCQNDDASAIPGNWEKCASGLDVEKIRACYEGDEGKKLFSESVALSRNAGASGSPTMFFGGRLYNGGRDELFFTRAVCRNLTGYAGCKGVAECADDIECSADPSKDGLCEAGKCVYKDAPKVEVVVLNDRQCRNCGTAVVEDAIKQLFKGAEIRGVDVSEGEGSALVKKYGLKVAPVYIFSKSVELSSAWKNNERLKSAFEKLSDGSYKLSDRATGSSYVIDKEYFAEVKSRLGVSSKPQIDFFVMSYCPYGNQAEEAVYEVYKVLGDKAVFNPRYVIYSNYGSECLDGGGLCSMHGGQELNQDIREKCVLDSSGIKSWFSFAVAMNAKCTAQNADSCWKSVAQGLGIDVAQVSGCEKDKGVALMRGEKELNGLLGVGGSPSIFIGGSEYSGPRDANSLLQALCSEFKEKPAECSKVISVSSSAPASGGCAQ